jgi:hypothetical protein
MMREFEHDEYAVIEVELDDAKTGKALASDGSSVLIQLFSPQHERQYSSRAMFSCVLCPTQHLN